MIKHPLTNPYFNGLLKTDTKCPNNKYSFVNQGFHHSQNWYSYELLGKEDLIIFRLKKKVFSGCSWLKSQETSRVSKRVGLPFCCRVLCFFGTFFVFFSKAKITQMLATLEKLVESARARESQGNSKAAAKPSKAAPACPPGDERSGASKKTVNEITLPVTLNVNEIPNSPGKGKSPGAFIQVTGFGETQGGSVQTSKRPSSNPLATPAQPSRNAANAANAAKAGKENVVMNDEKKRASVHSHPPPPSMSRKAAEEVRDRSNQRSGKKQRTDSIGSDRDNAKDKASKQTQEAQPVTIHEVIIAHSLRTPFPLKFYTLHSLPLVLHFSPASRAMGTLNFT